MAHEHHYSADVTWQGNLGTGTSGYREYCRDHQIVAAGKAAPIAGSSDAAFRGDAARYNPEELLVASLAACHMLVFLHLCADAGIVVTAYRDHAEGAMRTHADGSGEFTNVTLRPEVSLADEDRRAQVAALHEQAHAMCFIARSVRFPVHVVAI